MSRIFSLKLIEHVKDFIEAHQLVNSQKKLMVAVSGGIDSIVLLFVLEKIFKNSLEVLHFNHGTRLQNIAEEQLVKEYSLILGLKFRVISLNCDLNIPNFENYARNLRKKHFQIFINDGYQIFTGHHIDDSFEWSMMQSFKQGNLKSTLGIPVINGGLIRPFLCLTKKQITTFAKLNLLKWYEDESNSNLKFERNKFRMQFQKIIEINYPNYLKHYVTKQNALAYELKLHQKLFPLKKQVNSKNKNLIGLLIDAHEKMNEYELKEKLKNAIFKKSKVHRGEINFELEKLLKTYNELKSHPHLLQVKGPMSFSGGVKIFLMKNKFLVLNENDLLQYNLLDEKIYFQLKNHSQDCITEEVFPYLVLLEDCHRGKSSKQIHPLLLKTITYLKNKKIPYHFLPLILKKSIKIKSHLDSSSLGK